MIKSESKLLENIDKSDVLLDEQEYQCIIDRLTVNSTTEGTCMLKLYYDSKLDDIIEKEGQLLSRARTRVDKSKREVDEIIIFGMKRLRMSLYQEIYKSLLKIHLHSLEISRKRRELRPQKKLILANWLEAHPQHPYPNEEDKLRLADETGLSVRQVSIWFVNQRRKIKTDLKHKGKSTPVKHTKTPTTQNRRRIT